MVKIMTRKFEYCQDGCFYRLYQGSYETLQVSDLDMVFTSPPYNIGSKSPKKITHRKHGGYDAKSWGAIEHYDDSMPEAEYQKWQRNFLIWCSQRIKNSGVVAYNHKDRHQRGKLICPETWFPSQMTLFDKIVWDRKSTHNHELCYAFPQHEYVYFFNKAKHYYNRCRLDSVVAMSRERSSFHNAPMPLALAIMIIQKFCPPGGVVCDPFSGSATTMVAAYRCGVSFVGAELKHDYFVQAVQRFKEAGDIS
jgi:site-specific DNA-methyltransferase (adenine-specific)